MSRNLSIFLATLLWIFSYIQWVYPAEQGEDFYPYWLASRLLLEGRNPYDQESIAILRASWNQSVAPIAVILYTLPTMILFIPLAILPLTVAIYAWTIILVACVAICCNYAMKKGGSPLFPLLFFPAYRCFELKQVTLLWVGLTVLLIINFSERRGKIAGLIAALLPNKPQAGIIFSTYFFLKGMRENRSFVRWTLLAGALVLIPSLLIMPSWPVQWYQSVTAVKESLENAPGGLESFLPWGLILLAASIRLSGLAIAGVLQVLLFPASDIYFLAPLLIAWIEIGGWLGLLGVSFSWIGPLLYAERSNPQSMWVTVLLPFAVCAALRSFAFKRTSNAIDN